MITRDVFRYSGTRVSRLMVRRVVNGYPRRHVKQSGLSHRVITGRVIQVRVEVLVTLHKNW